MKHLIDIIETWHNRASDSNLVWLPFLFLKPKTNVMITPLRIIRMTFCFGLYCNFAYVIKRWFWGQTLDMNIVATAQIFWFIGFFLWFNLVTAFFWNRRARRVATAGRPES